MTPKEMDKELTLLLADNMNSLGFKKKQTGVFSRKVNDCEQSFAFCFTRDRGLPGTNYSMFPTLSFRYPKVDELHCLFMGKEYDKREKDFGTGAKGLYTFVPGRDGGRYSYCSDNPMSGHAELIFKDFFCSMINTIPWINWKHTSIRTEVTTVMVSMLSGIMHTGAALPLSYVLTANWRSAGSFLKKA